MKKNSSNVYIIAEIGVNHGGCIETAFQMIDAAKLSGADAVKFQTFKAENLVSRETPKVRYQLSTTNDKESHYEMIENLEFKYEDHLPVMKYCIKQDIDFISTPYDIESAKFLNEIGVEVFKTASADIVDIPLHKFIASTKKEVIISVGMATYKEIEEVLEVYKEDLSRVTLLHCVSNYPCAFESLNLNILQTLKEKYKVNIGYSDHAIGEYPSVLAVALGAKVIEKHFTIDKNLPGPDHKASSSPGEFKILVDSVRILKKVLDLLRKMFKMKRCRCD